MTAINDVGQALVPLLILAPAAVLVAGRATGRLRTSWWLLATACATWGLGQVVWTWFEVVLNEPVPYPGLADVGYLACIPLLLAGVLAFPSPSLRAAGRARAVVDGLITTSALLFASYGTFLETVYSTSEGRFVERTIAITYPVAAIVTVSVVLAVLARRSRRLDGPLPIVAAGQDFVFGQPQVEPRFDLGGVRATRASALAEERRAQQSASALRQWFTARSASSARSARQISRSGSHGSRRL